MKTCLLGMVSFRLRGSEHRRMMCARLPNRYSLKRHRSAHGYIFVGPQGHPFDGCRRLSVKHGIAPCRWSFPWIVKIEPPQITIEVCKRSATKFHGSYFNRDLAIRQAPTLSNASSASSASTSSCPASSPRWSPRVSGASRGRTPLLRCRHQSPRRPRRSHHQ